MSLQLLQSLYLEGLILAACHFNQFNTKVQCPCNNQYTVTLLKIQHLCRRIIELFFVRGSQRLYPDSDLGAWFLQIEPCLFELGLTSNQHRKVIRRHRPWF